MAVNIVTKEDLQDFKTDLLRELTEIIQRKPAKEQREWLKSYEVMKALNISKGTLQVLRSNGTLPFTKVGKCIYFKYEDIQNLLEQNKIHHHLIGQGRNRFSFRK
ncbi:MAG: helix-turn-helix domain-containing protein [Bacteroidia bacterium]